MVWRIICLPVMAIEQIPEGSSVIGPRPPRILRVGQRVFDPDKQVAVMAIINRTADSFYDKGRTLQLEAALSAARSSLNDGADWIDVGAVPFSPLAKHVSEDEETSRIVPFVAALRQETDAVISVDTFRSYVAREALNVGADAVNDTSGLRDPTVASVVAEAGAALIITHSKAAPLQQLRRPEYGDVVVEVRDFLIERADIAISLGVDADRIIIDPGHDLNKNTYHSLELTRRLAEITRLKYPVLASVSNKDFIAESIGREAQELTGATVAAVTACILQGARVVRIHDASAIVPAVRLIEAVLGWRAPRAPRHNLD